MYRRALSANGPAVGLRSTPCYGSYTYRSAVWPSAARRQTDRQIGENALQFCAFSAEQDKDRRRGVRTLLFKDLLSDSDGTFSLSLRGQAASGVDFVLADTEEHDYIQLTAL